MFKSYANVRQLQLAAADGDGNIDHQMRLDYWADQPRRRKNVHNFKGNEPVLLYYEAAIQSEKNGVRPQSTECPNANCKE